MSEKQSYRELIKDLRDVARRITVEANRPYGPYTMDQIQQMVYDTTTIFRAAFALEKLEEVSHE